MTAIAKTNLDLDGSVWLNGEMWHAVSDVPVLVGQSVRVVAVEGLRLSVTQDDNSKEGEL